MSTQLFYSSACVYVACWPKPKQACRETIRSRAVSRTRTKTAREDSLLRLDMDKNERLLYLNTWETELIQLTRKYSINFQQVLKKTYKICALISALRLDIQIELRVSRLTFLTGKKILFSSQGQNHLPNSPIESLAVV